MAREMNLINEVAKKLNGGNYRSAAESIVEEMKSLAEEHGDQETVKDLENVLAILFDIPNIDWGKADKEQIWEVTNFAR